MKSHVKNKKVVEANDAAALARDLDMQPVAADHCPRLRERANVGVPAGPIGLGLRGIVGLAPFLGGLVELQHIVHRDRLSSQDDRRPTACRWMSVFAPAHRHVRRGRRISTGLRCRRGSDHVDDRRGSFEFGAGLCVVDQREGKVGPQRGEPASGRDADLAPETPAR